MQFDDLWKKNFSLESSVLSLKFNSGAEIKSIQQLSNLEKKQ